MNPSYECMSRARKESRAELLEMRRWDIAQMLKEVELGEGSHENLSAIANVIYEPRFGWTKDACEYLRDQLIYLIGGERDAQHGCTCGTGGCDCRHESEEVGADTSITSELRKWVRIREMETIISTTMPPQMEERPTYSGQRLLAIADRIDEQFAEYQKVVEALALVHRGTLAAYKRLKEKLNE